MIATLNVLPKGGAMVTDYAAMANGTIRKLGWAFDQSIGPKSKHPISGQLVAAGAWKRASNEVLEIPLSSPHVVEYTRALKGDPRWPGSATLWPADQATADYAGVRFDPAFGGDHPELAAKLAPATAKPLPAPVVLEALKPAMSAKEGV